MKITLIMTPFEVPAGGIHASYPLGLCFLGSVLEKEGHICKPYNYLWPRGWNEIKSEIEKIIREEQPDVVGISAMTTNRISSFELAKLTKSINPNIKVIMGGVHPSMMYKQIIENFPVDFVVIGEGEETIVELVKAIENNLPLDDFKKIKGIAFKLNGEVIVTECRGWIKNLDELPFPKHEYFAEQIKRDKEAFFIASRGCPVSCKFCITSLHWGRIRRYRSVENVIEEVKKITKMYPEIEKIHFNDDEFIMNKIWILNFTKQYIEAKINIGWECNGRASSIDEDIIKAIKEAGCIQLNIGVESGSPKIIESIGKKITNEQIINAYALCKKYGIPEAKIYLMVGLPGETSKTINETIKLLKQISYGDLSVPAIFQLYPGTPIYEDAKKKGFINDDFWLTDQQAPFYTIEHSKKKLLYWALKISFFHKLYRGELWSFLFNYIRKLRYDKLKRIIKVYLK